MTLYTLLKWIHVLAAITALGANLTYGVWLSLAAREPRSLSFALRGISSLDNRLANPAYGLLLATGLAMVYVARLSLGVPWILLSLILYAATALVGFLAYSPALRRQVRLAADPGPSSSEYQRAARLGLRYGVLTTVLAVAIVFLMVVKPPLWGG